MRAGKAWVLILESLGDSAGRLNAMGRGRSVRLFTIQGNQKFVPWKMFLGQREEVWSHFQST